MKKEVKIIVVKKEIADGSIFLAKQKSTTRQKGWRASHVRDACRMSRLVTSLDRARKRVMMAASLARRPVWETVQPWKHTVDKHDGNIVPNRSPIPSKAKSRQKFLLIIKEIQKKSEVHVTIRGRHEGLAMQCMSKSMGNKRRAEVARVRSTSTRFIAA